MLTTLKNPQRLPLTLNALLSDIASTHNTLMIQYNNPVDPLPGQPSLPARLANSSYRPAVAGFALAAGQQSARDLVSALLCSEQQRMTLFACNVVDLGIATGTGTPGPRFHTQILSCINAVRTNPDVLSSAWCYASVSASLKTPQRLPFNSVAALTNVASAHNALMVTKGQLSAQFQEQADLPSRIRGAGYDVAYTAISIATLQTNARDVVTSWMCSESQRTFLFACDVKDIGVASGSNYYTKILSCLNAVRANPAVLSDGSCLSNVSISAPLASPQRFALVESAQLTSAALAHNNLQVQNNRINSQFPGQLDLQGRVAAAGYNSSHAAISVAYGGASARALLTFLLCSDQQQRHNLFACDVKDAGVATANGYLTLVIAWTRVGGGQDKPAD
ncbi:hypothetical protein GPECTOR_5g243 [Gonium pectorale]|uniref:SCP domain-containing protein n=1 Tax=Gonium pectorale TaxID=33097 RepID=A0A150GWG4_GONPE|nr:hypothetical protein GPECTOR_5g243 [Gonium pectorale]|eukprot:KXZ54144.1 hypothetical protein GPECTOR_5g243 [Gonium pectorale]